MFVSIGTAGVMICLFQLVQQGSCFVHFSWYSRGHVFGFFSIGTTGVMFCFNWYSRGHVLFQLIQQGSCFVSVCTAGVMFVSVDTGGVMFCLFVSAL